MTVQPCLPQDWPPEYWPRFSSLLDTALDLPVDQRAAWLASLPHDDAMMRPWLNRVLDGDAAANTSDFLAPPPAAADADGFIPGDRLGPYRLIAVLGEGGMGRVWRARGGDDGPRRDVALKLPHVELLGAPFRRRFGQERDVLAALSHPNIAQLYDAGVSADGHPYLALELVDGQPITAYCGAHATPLERRVDLLRQVLAALGYAHAHLIVHRDIKPSNVMVTADGQVKLLDFGIAKLLDGPDGIGMLTQPAARMATPGYSPPEQMEGGVVTVTTDLFAAGALLFELCTGQRPRPLRSPHGEAPLASALADAGAACLPDGDRLARRLRGDLDAIIAHALSADPLDRYQSADAMALDLCRWQDGLPVAARRIGRLSVAAKFVRRNRAMVVLAAVLTLAIAGGVAGVAWQSGRATREAARAGAIRDFLIGLLKAGDPRGGGKPNDKMTVRELLDIGSDRAVTAFPADPATEIDLLDTLGGIYDVVDEGARAEKLWTRRLDLERLQYGPTDPRVVEGTLRLVSSQVLFLDEDRAKRLLAGIRAPIFARYGDDSLPRAQWLAAWAQALRITHGGRDEALADGAAAILIFDHGHRDDEAYSGALIDHSDFLFDAERYTESLATLEKMRTVSMASHDFDTMYEMNYNIDKATRLEKLRRFDEADALYARAQDQAAAQIGKQNTWFLSAASSRGILTHLRGDRVRADRMFLDTFGGNLDRAASTGQVNSLRRNYGAALDREGRAAEAIPLLEQVLAETKLHPRDEQNLRRTEGLLGDAYDQVGRAAEARTLLLAARDEWLLYGPPARSQSLAARERWARFLLDHGDPVAAAPEFRAVLDAPSDVPVAAAAMAASGLARLAILHAAWAEADAQSQRAQKLLDAAVIEYDVRLRVEIWLVRVQVLRALGRPAEALALAQQALLAARQYDAPGSRQVAHALLLQQ